MHALSLSPIHMVELGAARVSGEEMKEGIEFSASLTFSTPTRSRTSRLGDFYNFCNRRWVGVLVVKSMDKIAIKRSEVAIMVVCCNGIMQGIIGFELEQPH